MTLYAMGEYSLAELQATMHAKGLTSPYARSPGAPVSVSKLAEMLANPLLPRHRAVGRRALPRPAHG
ncbi:MAG TPA: hypothetical protein VHM29_11660, partial [Acidimicrobiia bacterium]|nr:hypothetical protein [Acidimicrobiia bacterium]